MQSSLLEEKVNSGVFVIDGGMGAAVQQLDLDISRDYLGRENCVDILVRTNPNLIQKIHESYLEVGSDAVETNTFGASPLVLSEFDEELSSWSRALNKEAAEIARAACDRYSTPNNPKLVLGSMGPGTKLITLGQIDWETMFSSYREQALGLIEGGVDAFLIETCQDLLQIKCALNGCMSALESKGMDCFQCPIMVSVTVESNGTLLLGSGIAAAATALRSLPVFSLGLNCATGPTEMGPHIEWLSKKWDRPISVVPNAGLPVLIDGQASFPLRPEPFAEVISKFIDNYNVSIVGGCCGTTASHIEALNNRVRKVKSLPERRTNWPASCGSLYQAVDLRQDNSYLIVGERANANGSRKFRRFLSDEDWEGLVGVARDEVKSGAHVVDVCVDYVGRNGVADMSELIGRLAKELDAPLMLDSTEKDVLEAGLERFGGRAIINSINLENGEDRMNEVCPLIQKHGAACVALTIDEDLEEGMAKTAERKLEIASRIHALWTQKWNLNEEDLMFDPLTFTIATGNEPDRRLGLETLRGIEKISKGFPRSQIILGISNISFGLKESARAVLNSVFLEEACQRGLTAAIVHPSKIRPRNRIDSHHWEAAEWLIFDCRGDARPQGKEHDFDPLLYFISLFDEFVEEKDSQVIADLSIEERLRKHIIDGEKKDLEDSLKESLKKYSPLEIINTYLLDGMKEVGDLFGSGRMQLPFVLQSAEVMKKSVAYLEPYMDRVEGQTRGAMVLATVAGDVHDIGKNLVDIILTNNGFTVHNLGIKQPIGSIVKELKERGGDAIGMSGLLVKSVAVMEENLRQLNALNINIPVVLGGAALNRFHAESRLRSVYDGPLFYAKDAFEGLYLMEQILEGDINNIEKNIEDRLAKREEVLLKVKTSRYKKQDYQVEMNNEVTAAVVSEAKVPKVTLWGRQIADKIPLREVFSYLNEVALFRGQWGYKKGDFSKKDYEEYLNEHAHPVLNRLKEQCLQEDILNPKVAWGWWPSAKQDNDLIIFDPEDHDKELARFDFPRQSSGSRLCLADWFQPIEKGRDVVGLSCVTVGSKVSEVARKLFENDQYSEYLYFHGLGVEAAEALAELWHKRMRAELGINNNDASEIKRLFKGEYQGARFSPGYPACPEMQHQELIFKLLDPVEIGCYLTENYQIDPEQSTSAFVLHHPDARYFSVKR